jgi:hypothetical protein
MKIILYSTVLLCVTVFSCFITTSVAGHTDSVDSHLSNKQSDALSLYGLAKACMRKHDYKQAEVNLKTALQIINQYKLTVPNKTDVVDELVAALELQNKSNEAARVEHRNVIRSCVYVDNSQAFQQNGVMTPPHPGKFRPHAPAAVAHRYEGRRCSARQGGMRSLTPQVFKKRRCTHS